MVKQQSAQDLRDQIRTLQQKLNEIEEQKQAEENAKFKGKYFKAVNNYSCPEKKSDYWFVYIRVNDVDGAGLDCTNFQTDKFGNIEININRLYMPVSLRSYEEITEKEWSRAFARMMVKLEALHDWKKRDNMKFAGQVILWG